MADRSAGPAEPPPRSEARPPTLPLVLLVGLAAAAVSVGAQAQPFAPLCDGETVPVREVVVHAGEGERHLLWELPARAALWEYGAPRLAALDEYGRWLRSRSPEELEADEILDLEREINAAVVEGRLGVLRPLNCLESHLLARQVDLNGVGQMREFVAYVLSLGTSGQLKLYWLTGPNELPPKDDRIKALIRSDLQQGWRLREIIHNHTGPAPAAAPSAGDAQYGLAWAEAGVQRFVVIGGLRALDLSAAELRAFMQQ